MKRLLPTLGIMAILLGLLPILTPTQSGAINVFEACKGENSGTEVCKAKDEEGGENAINPLIQNIINLLFFVIGIAAVIMIIVGGIKYVTSNGDSSKIASAKNTILYAVAGLVVSLLAYAIVGFVLNRFS